MAHTTIKAWEFNLTELDFVSVTEADLPALLSFFSREIDRALPTATASRPARVLEVGSGLAYTTGFVFENAQGKLDLETLDPGVSITFPYRDPAKFRKAVRLFEAWRRDSSSEKREWTKHAHPSRARHHQAPMERIPFPNDSLDAVLATYSFEYVEQSAAAAEISRVLKPGSRFIAAFHDPRSALTNSVRVSKDLYATASSLVERALVEVRDGKGEDAGLSAEIERFAAKPNVKSDVRLVNLGEFLGIARQAGDRATAQLERLNNEYLLLRDSCSPLVDGTHRVFATDREAADYFRPFGLNLERWEPIAGARGLIGNGAVFRK